MSATTKLTDRRVARRCAETLWPEGQAIAVCRGRSARIQGQHFDTGEAS